jgi:hypothetical protein
MKLLRGRFRDWQIRLLVWTRSATRNQFECAS